MRVSLLRFRKLPLQVGPGNPGGAAFCTRSWQVLPSKSIGTESIRQVLGARCGVAGKQATPLPQLNQ